MVQYAPADNSAKGNDKFSWQERMPFEPNPHQLELEARGWVMIYRGLTDSQVEEAPGRQFERIEHMMFTGTIITDETGSAVEDGHRGEVVVEDDGCWGGYGCQLLEGYCLGAGMSYPLVARRGGVADCFAIVREE